MGACALTVLVMPTPGALSVLQLDECREIQNSCIIQEKPKHSPSTENLTTTTRDVKNKQEQLPFFRHTFSLAFRGALFTVRVARVCVLLRGELPVELCDLRLVPEATAAHSA